MNVSPEPATPLAKFSPIFLVQDLGRALAHYRSLGFTAEAYDGGTEYGFAERDGAALHLTADPAPAPTRSVSEAFLYVEDADALFEEWARPGIGGLTRRVADTPYQLREGSHVDPDGNLIRFGSPMPNRVSSRLRVHLEAHYGIRVKEVSALDLGVWHVERTDGPDWVARCFPARRPRDAVTGDADILRFLATLDYPSERCATVEPVSDLDGRAVLVTEWVEPVPPNQRRDAVRAGGGLPRLGELLGRLHTMPLEGTAITRPGGAWHHLADGLPSAEVAAASTMLAELNPVILPDERAAYRTLCDELRRLDAGNGLPEALMHPDFVLANVVTSSDGMVLVDWAGTGIGPRLWSLAFLLYVEGTKDLRRVDRVVAGYRRHVILEEAELSRLGAVMLVRPAVFAAWAVGTGRHTPTAGLAHLAQARTLTGAISERAKAAIRAGT